MHTSSSKFLFVAFFAGLLMAPNAASAATLRSGGTGTSVGMLKQVGGEFAAGTGGAVKVEVVPSLGSSGALRALIDGKLDLAVSARPLKPEEASAGLRQVLVMRTPYVLATSHPQPQQLKAADLPKLFQGETPAWPDGSPIRLILRPRSEIDTVLLGDMFAGMAEALEAARRRGDIPTAATDQDNVALAQRLAGSFTGTTLTQLATERSSLHPIPIDGVAPTLANLESGAYRFAKTLHFVIGGKSAPETQKFVAFLQSPEGLKALRAAMVIPDSR